MVGVEEHNNGRITPASLSRALQLIGDPWALQIVKEAFLGGRRFQDFQSRLGIPRQTLMLRLNRLTEHAIFYKKPIQHKRVVYEYHLTPKGIDLHAFVLMIWRWHRRWHLQESILPALYHRGCGQLLQPAMRCHTCRQALRPEEVDVEPGPGSIADQRQSIRRVRIVNELEKLGVNYLATVVLGDGWSILVLNAVMRGVRNYDALKTVLRISSNVLSARLKTLLALELLQQQQNPQDRRMYTYCLTDKGQDIYPMIISLVQWGDRWCAGAEGPSDLLRHRVCGAILDADVCCEHCGDILRWGEVTLNPTAVHAGESVRAVSIKG